jgi:tripartite motif-containing protein 2/3/tripartite motif-containing protein 71
MAEKVGVEGQMLPFRTLDGLGSPWGIAINQERELLVTEVDGNCVSVFSPSGEKLRSFGSRGSGPGQFDWPCEVTLDGEGNILVVDSGNSRIQKFTAAGQFLAAVGTEGNGPLQFNEPDGIAVNHSNDMVYVADTFNHRIQVLNSDLTYSSSIGKRGVGEGVSLSIWCGL